MLTNELIFVLHSTCIIAAVVTSLKMGKSCLQGLIVLLTIASNLFILKQITIFGFIATCTDSFTIGGSLALNLINHYYGYQEAQKTVLQSFLILILFMILIQFHFLYIPANVDTSHAAFLQILEHSPRIMCASIGVYLIAQSLDCFIFDLLSRLHITKQLLFKNYIATGIAQLIDTVLFSYLGLYGLVDNIEDIIIISYSIKLLALIIATPLMHCAFYITRIKTPL